MSTTTPHDQQLERRVEDLERRLRSIERGVVPPAPRAHPRPVRQIASVPPPVLVVEPPVPAADAAAPERPSRTARPDGNSIGDLIGGRVLAWIGGVATLLGIALFLVLAISRGWIGVESRVLLAGVGASCLMGAGIWLHAKRGRTEASVVLVAVATAGLFATLVVASHVYGLISPELALIGSMLVGSFATVLAIRWAGIAIAAIGLLGALASPVLVGAPVDTPTVALLAVAAACSTWTALRRRWSWLGLAAVGVCAPQWAWFVLAGHPLGIDLPVLVWFGGLGLIGAVGMRSRASDERLNPAGALLLTVSGLTVSVVGAIALRDSAAGYGPQLWLTTVALVHAAAGVTRWPRIGPAMRRLSMALGLVVADVAFGLSFSGIALAIGWAAGAVALAGLRRRALDRKGDRILLDLGIGAHIALTLTRALLDAPPTSLGSGTPEVLPLLSVAILASASLTCGHLVGARTRQLSSILHVLGLASVVYLTAQALSGPALAAAWAMEGLALIQLNARTEDQHAWWAGIGFLALAALHALIVEAPPSALVTGADSLPAAVESLGAIAIATSWAAHRHRQARTWLLAGTALSLLYLSSVVIITLYQPSTGSADIGVLDLSVRQQGQVMLSAYWSLLGLAALILGLRANRGRVRNAALSLLLLTVAKVFLYDLSTLTSLYRVISFIALGLLLLAGAFAYQRLRPPPVPDMRSVHPSQR